MGTAPALFLAFITVVAGIWLIAWITNASGAQRAVLGAEMRSTSPAQSSARGIPKSSAVFTLDGHKFSPGKYGEFAVQVSTQSALGLLDTIQRYALESTAGDSIFTRMSSRPRIAQLEIMAAHIAAYFVYVTILLDEKVAREGIVDIFKGIKNDIDSWLTEPELAEWFKLAVREYIRVLESEVQEDDYDVGFNVQFGPTAQRVVEQLQINYTQHYEFKAKQQLEIRLDDVMQLQRIVHISVFELLKTLKEKQLSFTA
jgi:hypothetical protein